MKSSTWHNLKKRSTFYELRDARNRYNSYISGRQEIRNQLKKLKIKCKDIRPNTVLADKLRRNRKMKENLDNFYKNFLSSFFYKTDHVKTRCSFQAVRKVFLQRELLEKVTKITPQEPIDFVVHSVTRF